MGFWDAIDTLIDGSETAAKRALRQGVRYAAQPGELVADGVEKGVDLLEKAADIALGGDKRK